MKRTLAALFVVIAFATVQVAAPTPKVNALPGEAAVLRFCGATIAGFLICSIAVSKAQQYAEACFKEAGACARMWQRYEAWRKADQDSFFRQHQSQGWVCVHHDGWWIFDSSWCAPPGSMRYNSAMQNGPDGLLRWATTYGYVVGPPNEPGTLVLPID